MQFEAEPPFVSVLYWCALIQKTTYLCSMLCVFIQLDIVSLSVTYYFLPLVIHIRINYNLYSFFDFSFTWSIIQLRTKFNSVPLPFSSLSSRIVGCAGSLMSEVVVDRDSSCDGSYSISVGLFTASQMHHLLNWILKLHITLMMDQV